MRYCSAKCWDFLIYCSFFCSSFCIFIPYYTNMSRNLVETSQVFYISTVDIALISVTNGENPAAVLRDNKEPQEFELVVKFPFSLLASLILVTAVCIAYISNVKTDTSPGSLSQLILFWSIIAKPTYNLLLCFTRCSFRWVGNSVHIFTSIQLHFLISINGHSYLSLEETFKNGFLRLVNTVGTVS